MDRTSLFPIRIKGDISFQTLPLSVSVGVVDGVPENAKDPLNLGASVLPPQARLLPTNTRPHFLPSAHPFLHSQLHTLALSGCQSSKLGDDITYKAYSEMSKGLWYCTRLSYIFSVSLTTYLTLVVGEALKKHLVLPHWPEIPHSHAFPGLGSYGGRMSYFKGDRR